MGHWDWRRSFKRKAGFRTIRRGGSLKATWITGQSYLVPSFEFRVMLTSITTARITASSDCSHRDLGLPLAVGRDRIPFIYGHFGRDPCQILYGLHMPVHAFSIRRGPVRLLHQEFLSMTSGTMLLRAGAASGYRWELSARAQKTPTPLLGFRRLAVLRWVGWDRAS